jgi:hypothetical protein
MEIFSKGRSLMRVSDKIRKLLCSQHRLKVLSLKSKTSI